MSNKGGFCAGYSLQRAAEAKAGTPNVKPTKADKAQWGHDWKAFKTGWKAAKTLQPGSPCDANVKGECKR